MFTTKKESVDKKSLLYFLYKQIKPHFLWVVGWNKVELGM